MADLTTHRMITSNTTALGLEPTTLTDTTTNEELDLEVVADPELYPWSQDDDEMRRCFAYEYFNWNPDIHVDAQMQQLERIDKWLSGR